MYNPTKYNYTTLNREEINGSRKYVTPDGNKLPSVTTILDATKSEEKKRSLYEWRKRVGEKTAQEITSTAAGRGTKMHTYLENYIKNGVLQTPGTHPLSIQSHNMAQQIIQRGLSKCDEIWGTEVSLYYPQIYAGTTDLVGVHDGEPCIMDFKQSNKLKKREWIEDYFLQLCAYANAHNETYNTRIRKGVVFMCTADNIYQEFIIDGEEFEQWTERWFIRVEDYYRKFL